MVPWDTFRVTGVPIFQTPTHKISPHQFLGSPKGPKTPPGGRFDGGFSFYWTSLGSPVLYVLPGFLSTSQLMNKKPTNFKMEGLPENIATVREIYRLA